MLPRLTLGVAVAGAALVTLAPHARATSYDAPRSSLPTHVNACWSSDNGTPVLDSFTLSTNTVDVTDGPPTVGVKVHAHDVGGPGPAHRLPDAMSLSFRLENAQRWATEHVVLHQTATQTWPGSWTVPQDSPFTTISVDYVHLQPGAGPGRWVSGTELGPDAVVQVTSAHPDSAPPRVADLRVTPDAADVSHGPRQVRLTATVDDDIGVADVTTHVGGDLVRLSPGSGPDEYRGVVTVSHWEQRSTLPIVVAAVDVNHVGTRLTSADLASLGLPPIIHVIGAGADHRPPRAARPTLSTHTIRIGRHGGWFTVRVHVGDRASGIDSVRLNGLPHPAGTRRLHLVSGSVHDGTWGRRIHLPQCRPFGSSSRVHVVAHDRAGHRSGAKGPTIDLTGLDRLAPHVTMSGGIGRAGLYFSEPVHGISTAGVTVSTSTGTTPMAGAWTCFSGHNDKTRTSCRTGDVRSARFIADDPGAVLGYADVEPDGHLDVLDRAGNPAGYGGVAYSVGQ